MAKIGYVRVSTIAQNTERQDLMMEEQKVDKIFREKISGKNAERPELQKMLSYIREGDTVIVESISRLARNVKDLLDIIEKIQGKGAEFVSLKEQLDTHSSTGKFMLTIIAAVAELERNNMLDRQAEGIAVKKEEDRKRKEQGLPAETYKGRKPISFDVEQLKKEVFLVREGKQTHREAMSHILVMKKGELKPIEPNTYFRRIKELGL